MRFPLLNILKYTNKIKLIILLGMMEIIKEMDFIVREKLLEPINFKYSLKVKEPSAR